MQDPFGTNVQPGALVGQVPAIFYVQAAEPGAPAFAYVSPQARQILGYEGADLISGSVAWLDLVHPDDRELVREADDACDVTGGPFRCVYRILARDGRWVWIRDEAVLVPGEGQVPAAWQGFMVDVTATKETEEQLRSAEQRFRTLVERIHAVTYIDSADADTAASATTLYISPQIQDLVGYSVEEWVSDPGLWERILHPDDHEWVVRRYEEIFFSDDPYVLDYRMIRKDGSVVWVHDEAERVLDEMGKAAYWLGVLTDTTKQKEDETRLQQAEIRFRTLVERIPAVTFMEELEGTAQLYVSPQVEDLYGYPRELWLEDPDLWTRLLHPDDRERVLRLDEECTRTGEPFRAEYRMMHRDDRVVWVREESDLVRGEQGEPTYWLGITYDVTQQKMAEEQLRGAELRFRSLVEQIPGVVYQDAINEEGTTLYASPQLEQVLGYTPEEWMADPDMWDNVLHPDDHDVVTAASDRADATLEPFAMEYRMRHKDGRWVWINDRCVAVLSPEGEPAYWHGIFQDITERKYGEDLERALRAERDATKRLRELDEMKNTFLSAVSHDLRTPLAAILGLGVTLDTAAVALTEDERATFVHRIVVNARKLGSLIDDLLDLDRLLLGAMKPERAKTDMDQLVRRVVAQIEVVDDHDIDLDLKPVVLRTDGPKVERIVENLVANALHHTPPATPVWVRLRSHDAGALLIVEDAGPGVPPELREEIFEMFRQAPGSQASASPGVGIGLALVRRLAQLLGGRAWAEERDGGGASFRVWLPPGDPET